MCESVDRGQCTAVTFSAAERRRRYTCSVTVTRLAQSGYMTAFCRVSRVVSS